MTVLLSEQEYGELRLRAGEVPLGRYCRNLIVGDGQGVAQSGRARKPERESHRETRSAERPRSEDAGSNPAAQPRPKATKSRFASLPVLGEFIPEGEK